MFVIILLRLPERRHNGEQTCEIPEDHLCQLHGIMTEGFFDENATVATLHVRLFEYCVQDVCVLQDSRRGAMAATISIRVRLHLLLK